MSCGLDDLNVTYTALSWTATKQCACGTQTEVDTKLGVSPYIKLPDSRCNNDGDFGGNTQISSVYKIVKISEVMNTTSGNTNRLRETANSLTSPYAYYTEHKETFVYGNACNHESSFKKYDKSNGPDLSERKLIRKVNKFTCDSDKNCVGFAVRKDYLTVGNTDYVLFYDVTDTDRVSTIYKLTF